jgi:hypothetical protein
MSNPGSDDGRNGEDIRPSGFPETLDDLIDPILRRPDLNQPTPAFIPPLSPQEVTMGNLEGELQDQSASIGSEDTSTWQQGTLPPARPPFVAPSAPGGVLVRNNA